MPSWISALISFTTISPSLVYGRQRFGVGGRVMGVQRPGAGGLPQRRAAVGGGQHRAKALRQSFGVQRLAV